MRLENIFTRDEVAVAEAIHQRLAMLVNTARRFVELEHGDALLDKSRTAIMDFAEDALYYAECMERSLQAGVAIADKTRDLVRRKYQKYDKGTVIRRWVADEYGDLEEVGSLEEAAQSAHMKPEEYLKHEQEQLEAADREELEELLGNSDVDPVKFRLDDEICQYPGLVLKHGDTYVRHGLYKEA